MPPCPPRPPCLSRKVSALDTFTVCDLDSFRGADGSELMVAVATTTPRWTAGEGFCGR